MVKRVLIRTLVVGLLLFIFVAGTLFLIRSLGASRLGAWKREMRAQGERLLVSELAPWAVVSNTMIPRLVAANKQLPECPFERGEFPLMEVTNGAARVAWACATNPWPAMHRLVDDSAAPLEAIQAAVKLRPRDLGWDYRDYDTLTVPFVDIRKAAQWLANVVIIELNRNRKQAAMTNLLASMDLVMCHEADGWYYQMIRVAIADLAYALSWEALQAGGWSDEELAALQTAWEAVSLGRSIEFSLRIDRAIALNYFEMARRGKTNAIALIEDTVPPGLEVIYTRIWQSALSSQDELMYLKDLQHLLAAVSAVRRASSAADLDRLVPFSGSAWTGRLANYRFPMARAVTPTMMKGLRNWVRVEAKRQLVLAAIGLERFRLRHGTYPEKLAQLVPEILPAVPVDFGDGRPLRYERQGEQVRLRSILEDTTVWPRAVED